MSADAASAATGVHQLNTRWPGSTDHVPAAVAHRQRKRDQVHHLVTGRRHMSLRGPAEMQLLGDCDEICEVAKLHGLPASFECPWSIAGKTLVVCMASAQFGAPASLQPWSSR